MQVGKNCNMQFKYINILTMSRRLAFDRAALTVGEWHSCHMLLVVLCACILWSLKRSDCYVYAVRITYLGRCWLQMFCFVFFCI